MISVIQSSYCECIHLAFIVWMHVLLDGLGALVSVIFPISGVLFVIYVIILLGSGGTRLSGRGVMWRGRLGPSIDSKVIAPSLSCGGAPWGKRNLVEELKWRIALRKLWLGSMMTFWLPYCNCSTWLLNIKETITVKGWACIMTLISQCWCRNILVENPGTVPLAEIEIRYSVTVTLI